MKACPPVDRMSLPLFPQEKLSSLQIAHFTACLRCGGGGSGASASGVSASGVSASGDSDCDDDGGFEPVMAMMVISGAGIGGGNCSGDG